MMENMKCSGSANPRGGGITKRILLVQFMLSLCLFTSVASVASQNREVNLTFNEVSLSRALKSLSEAADCKFIFNYDDLNRYTVTAKLQGMSVTESLDILLKDKPFKYDREGEFIVISYNENSPKEEGYMVTGMVKDQQGEPLPGVTVIVKGSTIGTATTADGKFELRVKDKNVVLVFSFVGMKTKEMVTDGDKPLEVVMEEEAEMLGEVVATGYQTISRERATGAVTILNREQLERVQATSLTSKIEGLVPGLLNYGGSMMIRGNSSFAVASTPLLVVDGIVMNAQLGSINPEIVETITVLKDAAATSLYGVRGSNGVIVITTKKMKSDKLKVAVAAGFYINPLPKMSYLHYASTSDIIDYELEYMKSDPNYIEDPGNYFDLLNDPNNPQSLTKTQRLYYELSLGNMTQDDVDREIAVMRENDFRKEARKVLERIGFSQDYNLMVSKGNDKSSMFFSLRYQNADNYSKMSGSDQYNIYFKNELDVKRWFSLGYGVDSYIYKAESSQSSVGFLSGMPYERVKDDNGDLEYLYPFNYYKSQEINETEGLKFMGYNVLEESKKNVQKQKNVYLKFYTYADFHVLKGLDLGMKFQYERSFSDVERYDEEDSYVMRYMINRFASTDPNGGFVYNIPVGGHRGESHSRGENFNFRLQLDYNTAIAEKHDVTILLGGEIRQDKSSGSQSEVYGYDNQKLTYQQVDWLMLSQDGVIGQLNGYLQKASEALSVSESKHRYVSAYANAGYTYDNRYSLNASVRVDQADLFGTDPKYRYRPLWSVGASWLLSKENFMQDFTWLNMLKLRFTYGITGNVDQSSSPYLLGAYITSPYTGASMTDIMAAPNKLLRWEKTSSFNVGVDFSLFSRLSGTFDFYRRYSSDLLARKTLDPSLGFETAKVNNGEMKNVGIEFSVAYKWLETKDWELNTSFTAAYNKNKIEKIGYIPSNAIDMLNSPGYNYLKGDAWQSVYAYRYAGLTDEGDPSVYDENGDVKSGEPVRNIDVLVVKGQLTPKWNGALDISLKWKTLEFFTKFVYYAGHSLRNDVTPLYTNATASMHEDMVKRWTPENKDTNIPVMGKHGLDQDREYHWKYADVHVLSASFIKCRNIGLSYSLPRNLIQNLKLDRVSFRAQINNPFYWAACHNGINPEAFNANAGTRTQQQVTTYVLGLNINF